MNHFYDTFASFFKVESFTHSLQNCKEHVYVCAPQISWTALEKNDGE